MFLDKGESGNLGFTTYEGSEPAVVMKKDGYMSTRYQVSVRLVVVKRKYDSDKSHSFIDTIKQRNSPGVK